MKFSAVLLIASAIASVSAIISAADDLQKGYPKEICMAGCDLIPNQIAKRMCQMGCSALVIEGAEGKATPVLAADGTLTFEKESTECAAACQNFAADPISHASCLVGCAAVPSARK